MGGKNKNFLARQSGGGKVIISLTAKTKPAEYGSPVLSFANPSIFPGGRPCPAEKW
jgi:hypothetical protein